MRRAWIAGALAGLAAYATQPALATDAAHSPVPAATADPAQRSSATPATTGTAPVAPPAAAAAPPVATTPAVTPAAPASTPAAAAPAAATAAAANSGTADGMREIPSGYRRVKRKGQEVYCRKVTTIGTRFADEVCFTREQLEEISSRTDSAMDDLNQAMKVCAGGGACQSF